MQCPALTCGRRRLAGRRVRSWRSSARPRTTRTRSRTRTSSTHRSACSTAAAATPLAVMPALPPSTAAVSRFRSPSLATTPPFPAAVFSLFPATLLTCSGGSALARLVMAGSAGQSLHATAVVANLLAVTGMWMKPVLGEEEGLLKAVVLNAKKGSPMHSVAPCAVLGLDGPGMACCSVPREWYAVAGTDVLRAILPANGTPWLVLTYRVRYWQSVVAAGVVPHDARRPVCDRAREPARGRTVCDPGSERPGCCAMPAVLT
eukprot:3403535-Rhodomonas_salina.4